MERERSGERPRERKEERKEKGGKEERETFFQTPKLP